MKVRFTVRSLRDLDEIGDWIATDDPDRASSFTEELRQSALAIRERARIYPLLEERRTNGVRRRLYRGYLIFFREVENGNVITRILHGSRDDAHLL